MKVSCLQENLAKGLGIVNRAVAVRSTLPITANVLLATDNGRLRLAATNLEIALSHWMGARIEEEGAITVPARLLADFVNSLPNEQIDIELSPRSKQIKLSCARNSATIGGLDAEDFPPIPTVESEASVSLDPEPLKRAITQVVFAAATDDSRPVLTGVHLALEDRCMTLAAADGFRLAVHRLDMSDEQPERIEVIVPARALGELNRLLGDESESVQMMFNQAHSQVLFKLRNTELVAQLIQGAFPNYGQLIPQAHASRALVDKDEFLRETKIASIFARDGSGIVRLQVQSGEDLTPGKLMVYARAEEIGDNQGEIDASVEGEAAKIAFNGKYLQDVLNVLDADRVALETSSPSSPGVIRPVGGRQDEYVHVVMPMFVQW